MQELQNFINWYLNPRARMAKKPFIWLTTVLFLIVGVFYYMDYKDTMQDAAKNLASLQNYKHSGKQLSKEQLINQLLNPSKESSELAKELGGMFGLEGYSDAEQEKPFPWGSFINFLVTLSILPLVMMRLRDMGKNEAQIIKYTAIIYIPVVFEIIGFIGISVTWFLTIPTMLVSMGFFTWIYMAESKIYIPPSQRGDIPEVPKTSMPDPIVKDI